MNISALFGCPKKCIICDCGDYYQEYVPKEGMLAQIDHMIRQRFPEGKIWVRKFKIHFSRMGEPSLNPDVIPLLRELPYIYNAHGLLPCIDTVAPKESGKFFEISGLALAGINRPDGCQVILLELFQGLAKRMNAELYFFF